VPRGVYPRKPRNDEPDPAPANVVRTPRKKGRKWSKARRAALSEKLRRTHGRVKLTPTLEAAVLVAKAYDLVMARLRGGTPPGPLEVLILQAHLVLRDR
jgi:hypothetical protein